MCKLLVELRALSVSINISFTVYFTGGIVPAHNHILPKHDQKASIAKNIVPCQQIPHIHMQRSVYRGIKIVESAVKSD